MTLAAIKIVLIRRFVKVRVDIPPVEGHEAPDFFFWLFSLMNFVSLLYMYSNKKKLTLLLLLLLFLSFMTLAAIEIVLIRKFMKVKADIPPVDGHAASDFFSGSFLS